MYLAWRSLGTSQGSLGSLTHYNVATKHAPVERARPLTLFLENDISDSPETLSGGDAFCCSRATWIHWTSPGRARRRRHAGGNIEAERNLAGRRVGKK